MLLFRIRVSMYVHVSRNAIHARALAGFTENIRSKSDRLICTHHSVLSAACFRPVLFYGLSARTGQQPCFSWWSCPQLPICRSSPFLSKRGALELEIPVRGRTGERGPNKLEAGRQL